MQAVHRQSTTKRASRRGTHLHFCQPKPSWAPLFMQARAGPVTLYHLPLFAATKLCRVLFC